MRSFPQDIIALKRDGQELTDAHLQAFVLGATDGSWADYQLSALLMAIFIRGMTPRETVALTRAMMHSGTVADLSSLPLPKVDKHSTGGVGDKVSLHLAPLVAACGVAVPMISGRGLGHTGGTLDKLESIPGFHVGLSLDAYRAQLEKIGCALIGQTPELAPADKKLYALRDVTATVACLPLICASIMSKKLAEGIDALVLDVKFGAGAFMRDLDSARQLATAMVDIGNAMGKPTRALLTAMDQPLGHNVGNALEVAESLACLRGQGPADLMEVTFALGQHMLLLAGAAPDPAAARHLLQARLDDGSALEKFREILTAQGGDPRVIDDPQAHLPQARHTLEIKAPATGHVARVDALEIAHAALSLGAGRARAEDTIDHAAGFTRLAKIGQPVTAGDTLALIHGNDPTRLAAARDRAARAITLQPTPLPAPPLILETIG